MVRPLLIWAAMQIVPVAVALAALTSVASASDAYVATGGVASVDRFLHLGVTVEGGTRVGQSLVFARGQLGSGMSGSDRGHGTYRQARGGLEARDCMAGSWICGFTGIDVGYSRERLMVPYAETGIAYMGGVSAVPRIGFDGGSTVHVRVALELPIYEASVIGGGASFGVGYKF